MIFRRLAMFFNQNVIPVVSIQLWTSAKNVFFRAQNENFVMQSINHFFILNISMNLQNTSKNIYRLLRDRIKTIKILSCKNG